MQEHFIRKTISLFLVLLLIAGFFQPCLAYENNGLSSLISQNDNVNARIDNEIGQGKIVLLFFYADWCGYCQKQKPIIDSLEQQYGKNLAVIRLNVEKNTQETSDFSVTSYPTMIVIRSGSRNNYDSTRLSGYTDMEVLKSALDNSTPRSVLKNTVTLPDAVSGMILPSNQRQQSGNGKINIMTKGVQKEKYIQEVGANQTLNALMQRARARGFSTLNESKTIQLGEKTKLEVGSFVSDQGEEIRLVHLVSDKKDISYLLSTKDGVMEAEFSDGTTVIKKLNEMDDTWLKCYIMCYLPDTPEEQAIELALIIIGYGLELICAQIGCSGCAVTTATGVIVISIPACTACALCVGQFIADTTNDINQAGTCAAGCSQHACYYVEDRNCSNKAVTAFEKDGVCYYGTYHAGDPEADSLDSCCKLPDSIPMDYCEKDSSFFLGKYTGYKTICGPLMNPAGYQCIMQSPLTAVEACSARGFTNGQEGTPDPAAMCSSSQAVKTVKSYPGGLTCWNCGGLVDSQCTDDAGCYLNNCVPSCSGGSGHCCPAISNAWSETGGCIDKCQCTMSSQCLACQKCSGGFCIADDTDSSNKCPGTCCGGICSEEPGKCCDGNYYTGTNACCSSTECGSGQECVNHKCLKQNYNSCTFSGECASGNCDGCLDEKRCCPTGMKWDGSKCVYSCSAPVLCPDTCNSGNRTIRFKDGQPFVLQGYDNNNDGVPDGSCPTGHNDVVDVTGDNVYDCCYQRETCSSSTLCSGGTCTSELPQTCSNAGYTCCDACVAGAEHAEYSDCTSSGKVCCEQCQFSGCNPACPSSVSCDLVTSKTYTNCCNPNDPSCGYSVEQYTSEGWQTCGYQYAEPCCAAWKETNYCYAWVNDRCGGGDCTLGMMHQTRDCWGTTDCPESRCIASSTCQKMVAGYSDAKISTYNFPNCVDEGTVNASCSYSGTFLMEPDGEIGDGTAQGNMILGMDGNTLYNENTQNSAFNYWEPLSAGSISNFIEVRHEDTYPSGCFTGYVYYGGSCYRYRCNSATEDCGVTLKSPAITMSKPALKKPLTRQQYYKSDVYPHVVWFAATSGADKLTADQMRTYVKTSILDPCKVTIDGDSYYSDSCLDARCYGSIDCLDEETAGFTLDIEPFFFYDEITEVSASDLSPSSITPVSPVIETQNAVIKVNLTNKLDQYGYGISVSKSFFADAYVNDTFLERKIISGLEKGSTVSLYYLVQNMTYGSSAIKVYVDPTDVIPERDEGNNWLIKNISILPKTDIAVNSVLISTTNRHSGDNIPVTVELQNRGSSATGTFVVELSGDNEVQNYNFTSLGANQNKIISMNWTAIMGVHRINITADAMPPEGGVIPETNETNNRYSVTASIALKGNTPPVLYQPPEFPVIKALDPYTSNTTTPIDYRIKYADADNDAPATGSPKVWIDVNGDGDYSDIFGTFSEGSFTMTGINPEDTLYSNGKVYLYSTYLPESLNYTYRFTATDATGRNATGMTGISYGPVITKEPVPLVRPLPGYTSTPTDPDKDGIYEDLNGNGRLDFADVVLYFIQMEWIASNEPISAFDLNGNGRIDFADIVKLFVEI